MPVRILDPLTGARRKASVVDYRGVSKGPRLKRWTAGKRKRGGRNSSGRLTVRHRGGGHKQLYRTITWGEEKENIPGMVEMIEYDPNRSAFLVRVVYRDGDRRYLLAWESATVGQAVLTSTQAEPAAGNRLPLERIPVGSSIFNVELKPRQGGKIIRSAGSAAMVQEVSGAFAQLRLASGEIRLVPKDAWATVGQVSNPDHRTERIGSAGRKRRMGWRPEVRGKAMNPVDHPHGGGEGHNPIGLKYPKTPTGKHALGVKTRRPLKYSDRFVMKRRHKK